MDNTSGVGVLDKAATVLGALEAGPLTLAGLVQATGLARPTAHRLATALEHHRLVARDLQGRFVLGPRLAELATAAGEDRLLAAAGPVLTALRDATGESLPALPPPGRPAHLRRRGRAAHRPARHRAGRRRRSRCTPAPPRRCCSPGRSPSACTAASWARSSPPPRSPAYADAAGPRASASARSASPRSPRRCAARGRVVAAVSVIAARWSGSAAPPGRLHAQAVVDRREPAHRGRCAANARQLHPLRPRRHDEGPSPAVTGLRST